MDASADSTAPDEMESVEGAEESAEALPTDYTEDIIPETREEPARALIIPSEPRALVQYLKENAIPKFRKYGVRCKLGKDGNLLPGKEPLTAEEIEDIVLVCNALAATTGLTSAVIYQANIKNVLELFLNRSLCSKPTRLPPEASTAAQRAYGKFEADGWGAAADDMLINVDEDTFILGNAPLYPSSTTRKRWAISGYLPSTDVPVGMTNRPDAHHPVYGRRGIMRGTVVCLTGKAINIKRGRYPNFVYRPCQAFGHNGVAVGQWWPRKICALRDGAHGVPFKGISGSVEHGAQSIVVNTQDEDLDLDRGESIRYSGTNAHENKDPRSAVYNTSNAAMLESYRNHKPIRVIRGKGAGWPGRPDVGYRYDGLYRITAIGESINQVGGAYAWFDLDRLGGQPPLNSLRNRPTQQERDLESRVTE